MSTERAPAHAPRDDHVLGYTRGLPLFIAPFLLVAFVLLYGFPAHTGRLFAWPILGTMTPMVLASAYLGGFWFFVSILRQQRWAAVKLGLPAVTLFATLLGIATVLHWDRFTHDHVAFWLWAGLYFTAPGLVLAAWLLTCRVVGAIFCLGGAGLGVVRDPRWLTVRLMLQVEVLMVVLMGIGAVRAHAELRTDRPLTWLMLVGFVAVLAGSVALWLANESRSTVTA